MPRGINKVIIIGNLGADPERHGASLGEARIADGYHCMVAYGAEDAKRQITDGPRSSWKRPK